MPDERSSGASRNVERVAQSLFSDSSERQRFLEALQSKEASITAVAALRGGLFEGSSAQGPTWLPEWISVAKEEERPGKSDRHDQGELYCLDLSSTFACAAYSQVQGPVGVAVDLCAAPGGKSIVASRYLSPRFLVANEVIRKRTAQLISNYKRCQIDPSIVTSRDPGNLAKLMPEAAQLVVADVPCSGQSLVLKGLAAPGAFHPATISMNARRQRRIMACAAQLLSQGGYLLYSTCTFSREENEENIEWFLGRHPEFSAVAVPLLDPFRSAHSAQPLYRLFPQSGFGAGAFCALLRRHGEASADGMARTIEDLTDTIKPIWRSPTVFKLLPAPVRSDDRQDGRRPERRQRKGGWDRARGRAQRFRADDHE